MRTMLNTQIFRTHILWEWELIMGRFFDIFFFSSLFHTKQKNTKSKHSSTLYSTVLKNGNYSTTHQRLLRRVLYTESHRDRDTASDGHERCHVRKTRASSSLITRASKSHGPKILTWIRDVDCSIYFLFCHCH